MNYEGNEWIFKRGDTRIAVCKFVSLSHDATAASLNITALRVQKCEMNAFFL